MTLPRPAMLFATLLFLGACAGGQEDPPATGGSGSGGAAAGSGGAGGGGGAVTDMYRVVTGARVRLTVDGVLHEGDGNVLVQNAGTPMVINAIGGRFREERLLSITWKGNEPGTFTGATGMVMQWHQPLGVYLCSHSIGSDCSFTVSAYDQALRGRVAASFSGTFQRFQGTGPETTTITGGSFELAQ